MSIVHLFSLHNIFELFESAPHILGGRAHSVVTGMMLSLSALLIIDRPLPTLILRETVIQGKYRGPTGNLICRLFYKETTGNRLSSMARGCTMLDEPLFPTRGVGDVNCDPEGSTSLSPIQHRCEKWSKLNTAIDWH
jgi:hypothetical protein